MNTKAVKCEIQDYIAVVTMDNPPVNALTPALPRLNARRPDQAESLL